MNLLFKNFNELRYYIESLKRSEKKVSLDYMHTLCEFFNNPQNSFKSIHVGGTNGKGSTVTYIKSILLENGYNVGTFTSPYVVIFNERITLNDEYISDADFIYYGNLVIEKFPMLEASNIRVPSFFEVMTLISFLYFRDKKVDFAIIEVGIGGLLDSTNVINPLVSVVTNVSYDHMEILGNTLEEIWNNKLGIMKPNRPFIVFSNESFNKQIKNYATNTKSQLVMVDKSLIKNITNQDGYYSFSYKEHFNVKLNMLGYHQVENAVLAIEVINYLQEKYRITNESVSSGLKKAFWPGRLEVLNKNPLIIIDGAHNIDGINKLNEFMKTLKPKYIRLVFAVSSNKDKTNMIKTIEENVDEIIFTHFMYKRSDESINLFNISQHANKVIIDDLDSIIRLSLSEKEKITIFCGSLFFISEVRAKFI